MDVHLDLVGGIAGDMFVAALLHAAPHLEGALRADLACCAPLAELSVAFVRHHDGTLEGRRFQVSPPEPAPAGHHHHHRDWRDIRALLHGSALPGRVRFHALAIFELLAIAEARIHGTEPAAVAFHEVGAWDSIADIVGAASLIANLDAGCWTASPAPLGSGRVATMHGVMPVPAPATAVLLEGFSVVSDGIGGERVTPTGAAILRHLCSPEAAAAATTPGRTRRLVTSGIGFGTRVLPGMSNCLRALLFDDGPRSLLADTVAVIEFEVDDQTPEDLAEALAHLRALPGVADVLHTTAFGKKYRVCASIRVLAAPEALDAVATACFAETTTIGLRHSVQSRVVLERRGVAAEVEGRPVPVKLAKRPAGFTAKAEADAVSGVASHAERQRLRRLAEKAALAEGSSE